jgi:threonine dehydrogenase-like Zn-dependent dehydrogenase
MITALEFYRSLPRYVASRAVGNVLPGLVTGPITPLRLVTIDEPRQPGDGWVRVRPRLSGICGSDLTTISGQSSFYFSPLVSMPFVPGHEVVGDLVDDALTADGVIPAGTRVVLDPVLGCRPRGLDPCEACAAGGRNRCDRVTVGHVSPGLQTGYCADTGGGWGAELVAHVSQLHVVPDALPDERAVLVEPIACAVHTALRTAPGEGEHVLVVGAGAVGLFTVLALRALTQAGPITVVAKHPAQAELARRLGATDIVGPSEAVGGVRRATRALRLDPERGHPFLLGGVNRAIDCVGSRQSLDTALRTTRAGGRVVLSGLPAAGADLTPAWYRELEVVGAYATSGDDFTQAMMLAADAPLEATATTTVATYPLHGWREALDHAQTAGRLGTLKVAFDVRAN